MPEILSKSAFAVRVGKSSSAVSNWIARGKLTGAALTADGRVVVDEAERQLALSVDPGRGAAAHVHQVAPMVAAPSSPEPASLAEVRLAREKLALEAQRRAAAIERGELMRVDEATRVWAAELDDLLLAAEQFVVDLPAKLSLGRDAIDTARREWREFRRRRAAQMSAPSAATAAPNENIDAA